MRTVPAATRRLVQPAAYAGRAARAASAARRGNRTPLSYDAGAGWPLGCEEESHVSVSRPPDVPRPRRTSRAERRVTFWLKTLALIAVAIYLLVGVLEFLGNVKATAMLFVIALFFAYLVYPLVRRLNERLPLVWSILLVYVAIAIVGAAILQLLIPPLLSDIQSAAKAMPGIVTHLVAFVQDPNNRFTRWIPPNERVYLTTVPEQIIGWVQTNALDTASKTVNVLLSTVSVIATIIVVPVLAAYMLLDAENLKAGFLGLVPAKNQEKAETLIAELDRVVGGFIRGQLIDGSILGAMLTIMLTITHVPYALLIGVVSGALNFIPYAGALIAFIPAVILAFTFGGLGHAVLVAILIFVIHQIDGNFVAPRVLKENVGLSPFWIVISILGGSELFGLPGTFLAVPVAAMIRVLREQLLPRSVPLRAAAPALTKRPLDRNAAAGRDAARGETGAVSTVAAGVFPGRKRVARVDVVGVPMDLGADRRGVDMGPSAIRYARLKESLEKLGIEVTRSRQLAVPVPESASIAEANAKYFPIIKAVCDELAVLVHASCATRAFRSCSGAITRSRWERSPASRARAAARRA